MRLSLSRQAVCAHCSTTAVAPSARLSASTRRSTSTRTQAAMCSSLANATPAQFSSFHGAKMFLPHLSPVGRKSRAVQGSKPAQMSFLGVGAPEALLVGIVALVVFGPKGLAEAAKSLGQTLRAFQPTIREVVEASQGIKGTLEQELGLDELREASRPPPPPPARPASTAMANPEEDPEIEAKRKASAAAAWSMSAQQQQQQQQPQASQQAAAPTAPTGSAPAATAASNTDKQQQEGQQGQGLGSMASTMAAGQTGASSDPVSSSSGRTPGFNTTPKPPQDLGLKSAIKPPPPQEPASNDNLSSMSIEELEAELARRRKSSS